MKGSNRRSAIRSGSLVENETVQGYPQPWRARLAPSSTPSVGGNGASALCYSQAIGRPREKPN